MNETNQSSASASPWPLPRLIAILLAVVSCFWGVLLLHVFGPLAIVAFPFGLGYIVMVGYIVRAVSVPALDIRRMIWGTSIAVQGMWLCIAITELDTTGINLVFMWWLFATVASVAALIAETNCTRRDSGRSEIVR